MAKFAASVGADYPILADPDKGVAKAYGVLVPERGFPARWTFYIGVDGTILDIDTSVNPATAGDDVAGRLAKLGIPRRKGT